MRLRALLTVAVLAAFAAMLPACAPARTVSAKTTGAATATIPAIATAHTPTAATTHSIATATTGAAIADTAGKPTTSSESPVPVAESTTRLPGRRLTSDQVIAIAERLPEMRAVRREYPGAYPGAYTKGPARWQVSFFSKKGAKEVGQVIIADATGQVLEQWTGFQVAWTMARGYPGAFGRHVDALYIWLPLCVLFMLPFVDPRRPLQLLHLDLLVLLSFSVSLAFFNHAHIYASVSLAYPPLAYLLARMLWLLRRPRPGRSPAPPLRLLVPAPWLALGIVFLIGFRVALNVTDSNVIDVGYAGVIGASKIAHDEKLYGGWPSDNEHGDTYGPVDYESYVPFEQLFGWSGTWDDLPAAHAAAIVFDLLALALMFLLGMRVRGPTLGIALAYAWASYPFTLFALESNSNDTLVAVFLLAALLVASSPPARGAFSALAGLTKFAPLALVPVMATHGLFGGDGWRAPDGGGGNGGVGGAGEAADGGGNGVGGAGEAADGGVGDPGDMRDAGAVGAEDEPAVPRRLRSARTRARALTTFSVAFVLTAAIVAIPALTHDSLHEIYVRTIEYQSTRAAPFSLWGLYGWHGAEAIVEAFAVALALGLAVIPRRPDVFGLAAACAAILIAVQLGLEYWFYLYIPWFFPLAMIAFLGVRASGRIPARPPTHMPAGDYPPPIEQLTDSEGLPRRPVAPPAGAASEPARLRLPSAAWPHSG